jgi:ubiquinone/menaquinone biosynthesis C-methylase UbiE
MPRLLSTIAGLVLVGFLLMQCRRPWGWFGRFLIRTMNFRHSRVTDWGLGHVRIGSQDVVLDIGCGGGRTVQKLAALAPGGKVYGIDYSSDCVAVSKRHNATAIAAERVEIRPGSASQLPFGDRMFDVVTAVETHYYWPNLVQDMREVLRVLKPGGRFVIIAEVHRHTFDWHERFAMKLLRASYLTAEEHRTLLATAGFAKIETHTRRSWLTVVATA